MRQPANRRKPQASAGNRARLVKMGKSRGIRLPQAFLDQAELDEEVELEVQESQVVIRLVPRPRRGWDKQFDGMTARGDDRLLDSRACSLTGWDEEKWVW
ncbi:MAG: AbrB/MazE/SpoVT family DNA-binding domain-containing protein [Dehalococcoidia bacterium]|nr:AbrB/MazE/SpoVT family DNA-binding domain-containing protein [Dehalococcoidia bacterium]